MLTRDEKLYFLTARGKDFYRELMKTGRVAVTGLNERWESVRLQGKVRNIGHENRELNISGRWNIRQIL